jgi:hypothetical protein
MNSPEPHARAIRAESRKGQGDTYTRDKLKFILRPVYDPTSTLKCSTYLVTYIFHLSVLIHVRMKFILTESNE